MPDPTNLKDDAKATLQDVYLAEQQTRAQIADQVSAAKTSPTWMKYLAGFGLLVLIGLGIAFCVKHG